MTIGAWIVVGIIAISGLAVAGALAGGAIVSRGKGRIAWMSFAVGALLITAAICGAFIWYRNNSESGRRALRDQESNLNGGIERTVSVYDINGGLSMAYSGRFDIETDRSSYILFDDENGLRHIVYYTTGTVIIDEH